MSSIGSRLSSPLADSNHIPDTLRGPRQNEGSVGEGPAQDTADLSDDESILSEVDEAQFENFDPENVAIEDRPALAIDEENLKLIGRHKRKRPEDGDDTEPKKRKRGEGKREVAARGIRMMHSVEVMMLVGRGPVRKRVGRLGREERQRLKPKNFSILPQGVAGHSIELWMKL